jgi:PAS domain S-box-containing protein
VTSAFRLSLLKFPGRSGLPHLVLLVSLIVAGMTAVGLHDVIERHREARDAADARMAAAQWSLLLARLESRLAPGPDIGDSETNRFQRSAAALRKDWPGALQEALLYGQPGDAAPPAAPELTVVSVAPGLARGGPEQLGQALPATFSRALRGQREGLFVQAQTDTAGGPPQLLLLAHHTSSTGIARTVQAYRFDAQRLAELALGPAAAPVLLPAADAGRLAGNEILVPLEKPAGDWVLRLSPPEAAALRWLTPLPWLLALLITALGGLGALLLRNHRAGADGVVPGAGSIGEFKEDRLLDFIELSADWLWETDAEHRFTLVTGGFLSVARLDPRDYLGKHRWDIDYLDTDAAFWAEQRTLMDRHEPVHLQLSRYNLDGELRHLEVSGRPMFDGERFLGYRGVGRDVTEQRAAAEALRASEARFRDLVELSSDWYWEQDAEFRYTALSSNPQNRRPTQFSLLLGHTPWEVAKASATEPTWAAHVSTLMAHQPFNNFVYQSVWFDGLPIWFSVSGRPLFDAAGHFVGYRGVATDITEERMTQYALSESETRYRNTFEHAPVGIATLSPAGIWHSVNDTTGEILGYRRAELVGKSYEKFTHPDDQAQDRLDLQQLTEGQRQTVTREKRFVAPDGSLVWARVTLSAQRDAYGTTRSLICVMEDITDRMAVVQALRASEERYRRLVELAPDGVFVHRDGLIQFANPASLRILGARSDVELVGKRFLDQVDAEFRQHEEAQLQALATQGGSGSVPPHHLRLIRLDGRSVDVEASAVVVDLDYHPAVLCMLRDITERLAADRALVESQSRYRDVVESVNEVIFQADPQGRFTFLNQAWTTITGFRVADSLGRNLVDFLHADDRTRARAGLDEVLTGTRADTHAELRIRTRDGQIRWIEAAVRRGHGNGISGSLDDISSRKIAELTLRNLNQELEARVQLRTAELENSNRELEAFSYSVSHDLRAPLRAIDGFAHIIEEDYGQFIGPAGQAYLTRIRKATHRMALLIDDLIELARLTRQPLHRQQVDVSELVTQILDELRAEAPERQVELRLTPGLTADADRALLRAVFDNLLRNAWKFTARAAHPQISVSAEERDGKTAYCVADNGVGFDMAFANKLFRPFHRLHDPAEFAGTGIGLATVERIIQRHGGSVWAESAPGEGAAFFFTLG